MSPRGSRLHRPVVFALTAAILGLVAVDGRAQAPAGSLPIEITADTLEVRQNRRVATFAGEVDAVQGDLVLSADRLRVHYRGETGVGEAGGRSTSIRRIEASGNVILSSPEETAQGEEGVYEVASQMVTLEGSVVLTKGQNVIRGERLEYDLGTGRSQVFARAEADPEAGPQGRVRAVFVPEDEGETETTETDGQPARRQGVPPAADQPAGAPPGSGLADGAGSRPSATWPPRPPQPKPALDG